MKVGLCFRILGGAVLAACGHPEQKFAVTVTDESGKPMSGIACTAGFNRSKNDGPGISPYLVSGTTDAKGAVELSGETVFFDTSVKARESGYYDSVVEKMWITGRSGKRWEPWPVELKLVMKKIRNPHPMYAVKPYDHLRFRFPSTESLSPFGFDLQEMDWVAPYGKGKVADFLVHGIKLDPNDKGFVQDRESRIFHHVKGTIRITFSNEGDGIQRVDDPGGSVLVGPSIAPEEGYVDHWDFPNWDQGDGRGPIDSGCYLFRVRTILDQEGQVIQGLYGKIDGGIQVRLTERPYFRMIYYLNANANDRNLEWDQATNLFQNLHSQYWPERQ